MKRPRQIGVWPQPDGSLTIVYPSQEAREGFREQTLRPGAVAVLRQHWGVLIQSDDGQLEISKPQPKRTDIALAVVDEHPGLRIAAVCSEVLYRLDQDEDDRKLRKTTMGLLNQLAERGLLYLDENDHLWPVHKEQTDASDG